MSLIKIIYLVVILINFAVAFLVLVRSKRSGIKWTYFILIIILNGWLAGNYFAYFTGSAEVTAVFGRVSFLMGGLIVPSFLLFSIFFPYKSRVKLIHIILLTIPPIIIGWTSLGNAFFKDQFINEDGLGTPVYGDYHYVFSLYIIIYLIITFFVIYKKYKNCKPLEKVKLKYVIFGFALASLIGSLADLILPYFIENIKSYWGSLGTIFISLAFAYSILRYRLLDIRLVIRKGIVYSLSIILLSAIYIYLLLFSKRLLEINYSWSEQATTILIVLIIALTIEPLRRLLVKAIDRVFYSQQKDTKAESSKLRSIMSSSLQFDQLIKRIRAEFSEFLGASDIQFIWLNRQKNILENYYPDERRVQAGSDTALFRYLREQESIIVTEEIPYLKEEKDEGEQQMLESIERELKAMGVWLVVPVGEPGELVGAFFFGKKENKEAYTADNLLYLQRLQPQMTGAIANALLYKQAVERIGRT